MKRRNTPQKIAVLELFESNTTALNQETIEKLLHEKMDRATIYRILKCFCEDGKLHKVLGDDGISYYALCKSCKDEEHHHNHFHFQCEKCNEVICLKEEIQINLPNGFEMTHCNCVITGICPKCKQIK
ncbi:Fur family transcriptional regulator [Faecalibacter rhinopitheci]|uniref:Transcriptional repressor n=1 Tax=Faecalibacter rhinopitheci TaxID=2779678 RepID=A0A8J7FT43_9FLAO|nr:transcriptional repressor [Faecalibacter rhinopitheci]MBF0597237.1 transcriptional repressor [Faecalibacter rhinopitheci]MBQ0147347.1 transcriptional repressor [Candidatus Onthonaster equi]